MKHFSKTLLGFLLLVVLVGCGSDVVEVTSGDEGEEPVVSETPIDESPVDDDLPTGPIGGGGTLATVDIVITHPDLDDVAYTISCLGDTATVIGDVSLNDFAACAQLGEDPVRERLLNGMPEGLACTEIYGGPDVATITGTYDGVDGPSVNTTVERTNGCGISTWDSLLSNVLPAAVGEQ